MTCHKMIVCGIDLGPATGQVVAYAAFFAGAFRMPVRLLYVIDYLLTPPSYMAAYIDEEKKREEAAMESWKGLLEGAGIEADTRIVMGRLHESFTAVLEAEPLELLVIGYKTHLLRPSSSERLVMSLRAPMLVVRTHAPAPQTVGSVQIRRILCPVDFSENSGKAVTLAMQYARAFTAELTIINAIPSHLIKEKWMVWSSMDDEDRDRFDALMRSEAVASMKAFCTGLGLEMAGEIFHGNPGEVISSLASEREMDLIVLGARGLSYLQSLLIGSTTEQVLKSSPCPVLIVH
ncbi:MAG: hypothetical protein C0402_14425 [Thermodesulfovibrio sp.]|nr:hypothetical protein [Thermodesulfovibrio sp.]